jgi:hypothetical protein
MGPARPHEREQGSLMATRAKDAYDEEDGTEQDNVLERAKPIIDRLNALANEQLRKKLSIEQRWIDNLRQYWGKYPQGTEKDLAEKTKSRAFVKLTRHKTNGWAARLSDLLFPTDEKNWGISSTPLPDLARAAKQALAVAEKSTEDANAAAQAQNEDAARVMHEQANAYAQHHALTQQEIDGAKEAAKRMEAAIEDQLIESRYNIQARDVIEDGCRLGTGILKGPLTSQKLRREWRKEPLGHWGLATIPDPMPEARRVDPWHFFPDMSARTIEEAEFTFERHLPTKKDLRRLALKLGFSKAAVSRLLAEGTAKHTPENVDHLATLREMIGEGEGIIDRYVMWEYHGALECEEVAILLRAMGQDEKANKYLNDKDEFEEYRVILYFCNNELLKIAPDYPLDSGESLYSVWNFEKGETSIFGIGVPELIADSQSALNGAWRMTLDNAALSVAPQVVIDKTLISPQVGSDYRLRPGKAWLRSSTAMTTTAANKPFETFDIPCNQAQLAGIIQMAKEFMDEEASMPTIAQGEQGAATQTLGGMSILFNSANVVFRRVVKSWDDDITTPTLRRFYDWNMQFNQDNSVKGDMQVDARGTSVLLVREIQSQNLLNVVTNWSVHQVLGGWVKIRPAMEKALQTMMVPPGDILYTQAEYDDNLKKAQEAAAKNPQQDPNAIKLQIVQETNASREKVAELDAQSREALAAAQYKALILKLQAETGLDQQELEQKYGLEHAKLQTQERMKAVDIAVEDRRAQQAKADGESETAAVGKGVG